MQTEDPITVGSIMSSPLETVSRKSTVADAARQMREADVNGLFVPGATPGIITTTDVVDTVADSRDPTSVTVEDVMTAPVERITETLELSEAASMMTNFGIKHLPVIDDQGDYVGMLSSTDVTAELA